MPPTGAVPAPVMNSPTTGVSCPDSARVGRIQPSWSALTFQGHRVRSGPAKLVRHVLGVRMARPTMEERKLGARASTVLIMRSVNSSAALRASLKPRAHCGDDRRGVRHPRPIPLRVVRRYL